MFQKWERKIDRKDRKLTRQDKVCSLHFETEFIEYNYHPLTMPDGSVFEMKRERPMLKQDAIPSVFPQYPSYKSKPIPKPRKPPKRRCFVSIIFSITVIFMSNMDNVNNLALTDGFK